MGFTGRGGRPARSIDEVESEDAATGGRRVVDTFSLRMPRDEAHRMRRFKERNRLSIGEFVVYLMNRAGIPEDGDERASIDYDTLSPLSRDS